MQQITNEQAFEYLSEDMRECAHYYFSDARKYVEANYVSINEDLKNAHIVVQIYNCNESYQHDEVVTSETNEFDSAYIFESKDQFCIFMSSFIVDVHSKLDMSI